MMRRTIRRLSTSAAIAAAVALTGSSAALAANSSSTVHSAQDRVNDAAKIVRKMEQNPSLAAVLDRAKGVFIIPHYGRGGFIVGGQGGGGVVLVKHAMAWSAPAFYSIGGGSIGAQAGGEGGSIAMILMTQKAVDHFENSGGSWSLNGGAGLTVVNWSGNARANTNRGDVVLWSNISGLYGGLTASVTKISPDINMDRAYYRGSVSSRGILAGNVHDPYSDPVRSALSARVASR